MIGRGSRVLDGKDKFTVIDLGNNVARFGLWSEPVDWQHIFRYPDFYLENIKDDEEIESNFVYEMPAQLRKKFEKTDDVSLNIEEIYDETIKKGLRSKIILERSLKQHTEMCVDNSEDAYEARMLAMELKDDIDSRIKRYSYCISKSTKNYRDWLAEDYFRKLRMNIVKEYQS